MPNDRSMSQEAKEASNWGLVKSNYMLESLSILNCFRNKVKTFKCRQSAGKILEIEYPQRLHVEQRKI